MILRGEPAFTPQPNPATAVITIPKSVKILNTQSFRFRLILSIERKVILRTPKTKANAVIIRTRSRLNQKYFGYLIGNKKLDNHQDAYD